MSSPDLELVADLTSVASASDTPPRCRALMLEAAGAIRALIRAERVRAEAEAKAAAAKLARPRRYRVEISERGIYTMASET